MLLTEIWETCSADQRHETSRLKHMRAEDNVTSVDEMVSLLNHNGQKQTYRSICQMSNKADLTKYSIVHIVLHFWLEVYFVYQHDCCLLLLVFLAFIFHKVV